uniref:Uncharacterized protein n=1 Tax=Equus asinus TaxID=9793 RepID=A0A8C4LM37_EQUAS
GSPSPSPSSGGLRWKLWRSGDSQYVRGSSWGKHSQQLRPFLLLLLGDWWSRGLLLLGGHVGHEVHHPIAVAKFIVIPGNELDKVVVEGNASPSIKGGRVGVTVKIAGDNLVLSVAQDALEGALRCLLHHLLDLIVFGSFLQAAAPVEAGMMFWAAPRPSCHSFPEGPSTVFWVAVMACTVVMSPSTMPKWSWMTLARGAKQLVVQEALLTIFRELS